MAYSAIYGASQKWAAHVGNPLYMCEKKNQSRVAGHLHKRMQNICIHQEGQTTIILCNSSGVNPELLLAAAESQIKHTTAVAGYNRVRIGFMSTGRKNDLPCAFLVLFS